MIYAGEGPSSIKYIFGVGYISAMHRLTDNQFENVLLFQVSTGNA